MLKSLMFSAAATIVALVVWELFVKKLVVKTAYEANYEG